MGGGLFGNLLDHDHFFDDHLGFGFGSEQHGTASQAVDPVARVQLPTLRAGLPHASITPADVIANTGSCPDGSNPYCGNPGGPFAGANKGEPYAFINVYFSNGASFDAVRFFEDPTVGGYESDNHTVGYFITKGGVVPEPATWAMMIAGFGLVGFAARRRGRMVSTLA